MREDNTGQADPSLASIASGGAAVGAGFGLLVGAVAGWLLGAQVTDVPTIGPVVGQWVLPSTLVGMLAGAAVGALIGALAAISSAGSRPVVQRIEAGIEVAAPSEHDLASATDADASSVVAASPESWEIADAAVDTPEEEMPAALASASAADALQTDATQAAAESLSGEALIPQAPARRRRSKPLAPVAQAVAEDVPLTGRDQNDGPLRASTPSAETSVADAAVIDARMEASNVSDELKGRNPSTFTGTQDAVDPETGAIGTAGTPVTTGYGVSGSTIGTGTRRRRKQQEHGEFRGATPDTASYEMGGRGTGDTGVLKGAEREVPVVEKNSDAGRVEASIPRDPAERDVYEQSEGNVENLERDSAPVARESDVQESAGTNIPGTSDPRGLGDNTDEPTRT